MLSVRQALGGPWAANLPGWAILFVPSSIVVFLFGSYAPDVRFTDLVLSAVAQHLAAGLVILLCATVLRRRFPLLPITLSFTLWTLAGVTRGFVGSGVVYLLAGVDPLLGWRVALWVLISWVWMPLFVYTAAQWEQRAKLAATRALLEALRDEERARSIEPAISIHVRLVNAVHDAIHPVIEEIKRSLTLVSTGIDPEAMRRIGDKLAAISAEAAAIVSGILPVHAPSAPRASNTNPLYAAVDFERERAPLAAVLTGVMLLTITAPMGLAGEGFVGVFHVAVATAVTTGALVVRAIAHKVVVSLHTPYNGLIVLTAYAVAGFLGSLTMLAFHAGSPELKNWLLAAVLPGSTVFVAALVSGAVGLSRTNQKIDTEITELDQERHDLKLIALITEDRVRQDLSTLMHGPVQGRLSACVMALNFHAAELEKGNPERVEAVTRAVLEHLEAASVDLELLGKTILTDTRP
ncbi:MAG: hypothetical protein ACOH1J_08545 [Microbacteriaceae bacterium]